MIRHHPAIGQVHVFMKLDRDHLRVNLDDNAFQPAAHAFAVFIMVAVDLDDITHAILTIFSGWGTKRDLCQCNLLNLFDVC